MEPHKFRKMGRGRPRATDQCLSCNRTHAQHVIPFDPTPATATSAEPTVGSTVDNFDTPDGQTHSVDDGCVPAHVVGSPVEG